MMKDTEETEYFEDEMYGTRLLISVRADKSELLDNVRAARAILYSFPDTSIIINEHRMLLDVKNPEYIIDQLVGDRKGVESERGIKAAFRKAIKQKCKVVVIDLDMHLSGCSLKTRRLSVGLFGRRMDFRSSTIERCYFVYNGKAILFTSEYFMSDSDQLTKELILNVIEKLKAQKPAP